MNPTPTTPAPAPVTVPQKVKVIKETPQVQFIEKEFEGGDAKGIKYVVPTFRNLPGAVTYCTKAVVKDEKGQVVEDAIDGNEVILSVLNQMVAQRIAMKIKGQKLPRIDTNTEAGKAEYKKQVETLLAANGGYAFSLKEAEEYRPGQREASLSEQMDDLFKQIKSGEITNKEDIANMVLRLMPKKRGLKK